MLAAITQLRTEELITVVTCYMGEDIRTKLEHGEYL